MPSYEELRNKNIEDNKRILAELGILNPFKSLPRVQVKHHVAKRKRKDPDYELPEKIVKKQIISVQDGEGYGTDFSSGRRRSSRIKGELAPDIKDIEEEVGREQEASEAVRARRQSLADRPMFYGAVSDVEVGTWWATRIECNHANIHRPPVSGIHSGPDGAYSIAMSGGYEDDIDLGECFTYTGEGGRDLKGTRTNPKNLRTAPQSKDQCLSRGNAALVKSTETKKPVRVLRGYKSPSNFAPEEGYRYDGLYQVEKFWYTVGLAGFGVYKFALKRMSCQASPPWVIMDAENNNVSMNKNEVSSGSAIDTDTDLDQPGQDSGFGSQSCPDSQDEPVVEDEDEVTSAETDSSREADDVKDDEGQDKQEAAGSVSDATGDTLSQEDHSKLDNEVSKENKPTVANQVTTKVTTAKTEQSTGDEWTEKVDQTNKDRVLTDDTNKVKPTNGSDDIISPKGDKTRHRSPKPGKSPGRDIRSFFTPKGK